MHAVKSESKYYGLKLNQSKCAAITSTGQHGIKFCDGTPVPHDDQVTCLRGIIIRQVNIRAEIENRIAATMATWRRMHVHVFFKNSNSPTRWKLLVYNSMIRSKLLCGLDTLEIPQALLSKFEAFQLKGLRKINVNHLH